MLEDALSNSQNQNPLELQNVDEILNRLSQEDLLIVNSRRRNGVIICKQFYAEFAGPGAAVGGFFDVDCKYIIPVGELSLIYPSDQEERQKAYLIRRQWIRLTHQLTDDPMPSQRAQMILNQFENYFGAETIQQIPDDAFALLVGVLPQTVRSLRQNLAKLSV